ncbi:MAG: hypothetical protein M3Z14_07540 [Candidatus Eremiobacteraeota bacterium]|nr:hypothetical protein [Candidatus Eremiobacteraeota bacterium]
MLAKKLSWVASFSVVILPLWLFGLAPGSAQSGPANTIAVPLIKTSPPIDGNLSDPGWAPAAKVTLTRNLRDRSAPAEQTTVFLETDGSFLYVAFDARQNARISATQHTNDVGQGSDDLVSVYLWPSDAQGFFYGFSANPIGTHYQYSSENTAYAPSWLSAGKVKGDGYSVTLRIPLRAIRGANNKAFRLQLERFVRLTGNDYVWAYDPGMTGSGSVLHAGHVTGLVAKAPTRPQPRFGLYTLGEYAAPSAGVQSTSRMGLDASIPFTAGSSFVAAVHPDYSNVEQDQQTIAPTAFARYYNEVRPFFTQLQNYYGGLSCGAICPQELYTPIIPTPRDGFALEGHEGTISYAAFDAIGVRRNDLASVANYSSKDQHWNASLQNVAARGQDADPCGVAVSAQDCYGMPGLKYVQDSTTVASVQHGSTKGLFEYANYGFENGTFAPDSSQARRFNYGIGAYDKDSSAGIDYTRIGSQYAPLDGYVTEVGVHGYNAYASRTWHRSSTAFITRYIAYVGHDRYYDNSTNFFNLGDDQAAVGITFRNTIHVRAQTGSSYLRLGNGVVTPLTQNGVDLSLKYNTPTQTYLSYYTGRFGPGKVDTFFGSTGIPLGGRGLISLSAFETFQGFDAPNSLPNDDWLLRASYTYQKQKDSSLAFGVRRIIGFPTTLVPLDPKSRAQSFQSAWNLSAAYYKRLPHDELYLVYGDANAFSTRPIIILKLIHYFGAEKGT